MYLLDTNVAIAALNKSDPVVAARLDAEHAGEIRAAPKRVGRPIGPYDLLIAAQARRRGAVLVTANIREFSRVPELVVENWAD